MKAFVRALVRSRAARRCEYCQLHERDLPLFPFHSEHIVARKHRGTDDPENLAWACHHCNLGKSSNLSGIDPTTGRVVLLFNPRQHLWKDATSSGMGPSSWDELPVPAQQLPF